MALSLHTSSETSMTDVSKQIQDGQLHLDVVLTCLKSIVPTLLHHQNRTCASVRSLLRHS